jgi:hypothetical protein
MTKIELYIKEKEINISDLERKLKLPSGSIRITGRGVPAKHIDKVTGLLVKEYGYNSEFNLEEVDKPVSCEIVEKRVWNKNFIPDYKDGIVRYQDPENGLWKRLSQWQTELKEVTDEKTGEVTKVRKIKEDFLPLTDEIFTDKIGRYYISKCGIKVYKFDKE